MTPSTHDPRPPYKQAADTIREEIKSGRLRPGDQLPSHRELQERFDVANMTARSALRVLRDEGLIYTIQGRGSYVADAVAMHGGSASNVEAKTPSEDETGAAPDDAETASPLTETLLAIRDQLRTLNADVQALKQDVAELKAERRPENAAP